MDDAAAPVRLPRSALPPRDWAAAARTLEDDGVVHLPGALSADALARLEAAVDHALAHPSKGAKTFYPNEPATFHEDTGRQFLGLVRELGIDTTVAALWGVDDLWYLGEQLFLKEGGAARRTPWHQDTSYLRMMGSQLVACWISLDPLPAEHCLEFVRGSHKGELFNGSAFAAHDDTAPLYRHSPLRRLPDVQANRGDYDIVSWDITPGDIVVFHLGALHGGAGTAPGMRRRTASLRFLGPNVCYDGRSRDEKGEKAGNDVTLGHLYDGQRHGDPFRTELLPKV